jgi:hypothetical protein
MVDYPMSSFKTDMDKMAIVMDKMILAGGRLDMTARKNKRAAVQ